MDVVESQLLALPGMQVPHARQLIRAGFTSIHALAEAPADGRMVANKVKSLSVQQAKVLLQAARRERTKMAVECALDAQDLHLIPSVTY